MTVQRYKKNRQNAIVVLNHVPPCPESRAFLVKNPVHPPLIPLFVAMYRQLHPDVSPSASPRIASCIGTWLAARRHAVLGASGAQLLALWVSWLIGGKAKM